MRLPAWVSCPALTGLVLAAACTAGDRRDEPRPAEAAPVVAPFAAGTLSTVNGISFTADGRTVYLTRRMPDSDSLGRPRVRIVAHRLTANAWSPPVPLPFPGEYTDYQPVLSPDGTRLYFTSTRPLPGTTAEVRQNIWFADATAAGWGQPAIVRELVTSGWDGHAVPTRSGRLYFVSERPGGRGGTDIWFVEPAEGRFGAPANVEAVNSELSESDLYVDPDERLMIFNRYVDSTRTLDLWISVRRDNRWETPHALSGINGPGWELSPTITPDGRYLFFQLDGTLQRVPMAGVLTADELVRFHGETR